MFRLRKAFLVAVEGIDGAGVSTHSRLLAEKLSSLGLEAHITKEPTRNSPLAGLIRRILAGGELPKGAGAELLALLFAADRLYHLYYLDNSVLSMLSSGLVVVTDRYKYSSIAYQSSETSMGRAARSWVEEVNIYAPPPHILVYLDVPVETSLERLRRERSKLELFEKKENLKKVKKNFEELLDELSRSPEYCIGDRMPWQDVLRALYGDKVLSLWGVGNCYPSIVVVREVIENRVRSIEEVAGDVASGVLYAAQKMGLIDDKTIKPFLEKARSAAATLKIIVW